MKPKIFGSLVSLKDWPRAMRAYQRKEMDGLELRLDAFSPLELVKLHQLVALERKLPPLLLTVRSPKEGGLSSLSLREKIARFKLFMPFADALDTELGSRDIRTWVTQEAKRYGKGLIISYHDLKRVPTPVKLGTLLKSSLLLRPTLTKIAVTVKTPDELLPLILFLRRNEKKGLILIAMGGEGSVSRVLFPALGSRITFGSLGSSAAPGQIPVPILYKRLQKIFR